MNPNMGWYPNQLPFYAYEATYLIVDAIRRAGSDKPADIEAALRPPGCRRCSAAPTQWTITIIPICRCKSLVCATLGRL